MNQSYILKHWLATLIVAPFLPSLYELIFGSIKGQIVGLLEVYPITIIFSVIFSIPTLVIYYFIFIFLIRNPINSFLVKSILISWTIVGIVITILMIGGSLSKTLIFSYSLAAIVTGTLFRITRKVDVPKNNESPSV